VFVCGCMCVFVVGMCAYMYLRACMQVFACMCACVYVVCVCLHKCVCVCVCVCACIFMLGSVFIHRCIRGCEDTYVWYDSFICVI